MKILIYMFMILLLLAGCANLAKHDDGTNRLQRSTEKIFDDGTNLSHNSSNINNNDGTNRTFQSTVLNNDDGTNRESLVGRVETEIRLDREPVVKDPPRPKPKVELVQDDTTKVQKEREIQSVKQKKKEEPASVKVTIKEKKESAKKQITGEILYYPVSKFSIESDYVEEVHSALGFRVDSNTPIKASAPGIVIFSEHKGGLGNSVFLYHNNQYITVYYNLKTLNVAKGDYVQNADTVIALADKTFNFRLMKQTSNGNVVINPKEVLRKR